MFKEEGTQSKVLMFWGSVAETQERFEIACFCFIKKKTEFLLLLHSHEGCCWSCLLLRVSMVVFHCSYQHHYHDVHPSLVAEVPLHPHVSRSTPIKSHGFFLSNPS